MKSPTDKNRKVNPTRTSLSISTKPTSVAPDENRKVNSTCTLLDLSESEPSSKEEEGMCLTGHTFPPFVHEEAPTPTPETLSFFIDFNGRNPPTVTHQMHRVTVRNGKPQFFDSPELAKARADLCAHLEQHSPDAPFEGPLSLSVAWLFRDSRNREGWRDTKPDTDNLEKLLKDCMTRTRFWIDDAQVVAEHVFKRWSLKPGIVISITQL